jgi:hypothetical protein
MSVHDDGDRPESEKATNGGEVFGRLAGMLFVGVALLAGLIWLVETIREAK